MASPLTPRRGYRLSISQWDGGRPDGRIECNGCHWSEHFAVALDDAAKVGGQVEAAVGNYTKHSHPQMSNGTYSEAVK